MEVAETMLARQVLPIEYIYINLRSWKYDRYEYGKNSILFLQMQDL